MAVSKYRSIGVWIDNQYFPSQLEGRYYSHIKLLKKAKLVTFWHRQVPFHLPGGKKYFCDFLVFYSDGSCEHVDVKGVETQLFKLKKSLVESLYPVKIKIVKRGDF